jgi:hypothetical protein
MQSDQQTGESAMTDDAKKSEHIKLVESPEKLKAEGNPGSVFDDLASLRKASKLIVQRKAVLVNVAVDKPPNNSYFRCHRELMLDDQTVLRDTEGTSRVFYYVVPHMREHPKLKPRLRRVTLVLTMTWPSGNILIWPVPILTDREFPVWKSARAAYELALDKWMQMVWAEDSSDYQLEAAEGIDHEPTWPEKDFGELLKLGFDGKVIDSEEHPYVRRLRGLID